MKQFFKLTMASMVGTGLALVTLFFMGMVFFAAMAMQMGDGSWEAPQLGAIEKDSVLRINFNGPLKDHAEKKDLFNSLFRSDEPPVSGLYEMSQVLKKAADDDRIRGLFLKFEAFQSGMANAEELRRQILKFKSSGKFVIAYGESYSELDFLVASAADEVILYPKGYFEWDGLYTKLSYLKNTLKKIDVTPQIFRVGRYKSAIEPFINDKMSDESREQVEALLEGNWNQLIKYAMEKTKLSEEALDELADNLDVMFAKEALDKGFVNSLSSYEEVEEKFLELTSVEDKPKYVSWRGYYKELKEESSDNGGDKIALVFSQGGISSGQGDQDGIYSESLTKVLHKLRRDKKVKAVVMRVNSPGGSALASDVIWMATEWLKESKPVVTSFGNVAASGGYYMSAGSQYIFAEPTTITGSIGVFGLVFSTKKLFNERLGVTFDTAKSHRYADMQSLVRLYEPEESQKIQKMVDSIYEDFLSVVTLGRQQLQDRDQTHELAQGRVWIGADAKENGLVDEFGGIEEAVAKAAELAELSDYQVEVYPKEMSAFQEFLKGFGDISLAFLQTYLPESLVKTLLPTSKQDTLSEQIQMRLPFEWVIH